MKIHRNKQDLKSPVKEAVPQPCGELSSLTPLMSLALQETQHFGEDAQCLAELECNCQFQAYVQNRVSGQEMGRK